MYDQLFSVILPMNIKRTFRNFLLFSSLSVFALSAQAQPEECAVLTEPATFLAEASLVCLQKTQVTDNNGTFLFKASLQWLGAERPNHFQLVSSEADDAGVDINSPTFMSANNTLTIPKIDIPGIYGTERFAVNLKLMQEDDTSLFELSSVDVYINPDFVPNETWVPYGMLDSDERRAVDLLARSLPYAKLADAVYDFDNIVDGWDLIDDKSRGSGMQAALYRAQDSDALVLAFRGTESCDFPCSLKETKELALDVFADSLLTLGQDGSQFDDAMEYAQEVVNFFPDRKIYVTGHSLGGGLAQAIGAAFGLETFAFNSAPVPDDFLKSSRVQLSTEELQEIIHVIADIHDPVSNTDESGKFYLNADHLSPLIQFDFDLKEVVPGRLAKLNKLRFDRHSITTFVDNAGLLLTTYEGGW